MDRPGRPWGLLNGWWVALIAIVLGGLLFAAGRGPQRVPAAIADHVPGEVLIRFKDHAGEADRTRVRSSVSGRRVRGLGRSVEQLTLGRGRSTESAIRRLSRDPAVEYAEPNYLFQLDVLPDDSRFDELYGLRNTGQTGGTAGADIHAQAAWELTTGSHEVVIGVIDSGIDYNHPDLAANIWINPGEVPGNGIDDDDNGYVDDVRGWDFANDDNDPFDDAGHGTHVAGTIGAVGDNALGVTGVAWKVRIVPLKFIAANGFGNTADAAAAVKYATAIGADATNNSWGGGSFSRTLADAIQEAADANIVFVTSSGNQGRNNDQLPHYPSSYSAPNVISVTAVNHDDVRPVFANVGPLTVDLAAPGVNVLSTLPKGAYGLNTGTSMAAPHVAGAVALIRSMAPEIGVVEIRTLLMDHVDPQPTLEPLIASGGRMNLGRSLAARDRLPPGALVEFETGGSSSNSIELNWIATGDDGDSGAATSYDLRYAVWPIDAANFAQATRVWQVPRPQTAGSAESVVVERLEAETVYYFALRAHDEWGNAGPPAFAGSGTTLPAPVFASDPPGFEINLFSGQTTTRSLSISNVGPGTLDWRASLDPDDGWVLVSPEDGRLLGGETRALTLRFETRDLSFGRFETSLDLTTNDPDRPLVSHPIGLVLVGAPAIEVAPSAIDLGEVVVGASSTATLVVRNFGLEQLVVDPITSHSPAVTISASRLEIAPATDSTIELRFSPVTVAALDATLSLSSNAPNAPSIELPLGGNAVAAPAIAVEPAALSERLESGATVVRPIRIYNPGEGVLLVDLRFEPGSDPGPLLVSPLVNGGFETGDFTGWEATTNGLLTLIPWTVSMSGAGSFENSEPIEGSFDALNAFEGQAGLRFDLKQLLEIPRGTTRAELSYSDRIQWEDFGFPADLSRFYRSMIENPNGAVLDLIVEKEILFDGTGYTDLGWQRRSIDLAPYADSTVRLHVREVLRESLTGLAQLELDDFSIDIEGFPDWFGPGPKRVVVDPGQYVDVDIVFDARELLTAAFDARIRLETNVPGTPVVTLPVTLDVFGVPRFSIRGLPTVLLSEREFTTSGASTVHELVVPAPPLDEGVLELIVRADVGNPGESVSLETEGRAIGLIGNTGADCVETVKRFELSADFLAEIVADGVVHATVRNSSSVDAICTQNRHTLRLTYDTVATHLDFGTRFVGSSTEIGLVVENLGSAPLELHSIESDRAEFVPGLATTLLDVGESLVLSVAFEPPAAGVFVGTLGIETNDPETPRFEIALTATAVSPPTIDVDPLGVEQRLPAGGRSSSVLTITNRGDVPLDYQTELEFDSATFATVSPAAGSVPPNGSAEIVLGIDADGLAPGIYEGSVRIGSELAVTAPATIPLRLIVRDAPDIAVDGPPVRLSSAVNFGAEITRTVHRLQIERPVSSPARLALTLIGDFGAPGENARVLVDGMLVGIAGEAGPDCHPHQFVFELDGDSLASMASDGEVVVSIQNSVDVNDQCVVNQHRVQLDYHEFAAPLAIGSLFVGWTIDKQLVVRNVGTEPLDIATVTTLTPELSVQDEHDVIVAPGESWHVAVSYTPAAAGPFSGSVVFESNDPDEPVTTVDLVAIAEERPGLRVEPSSLEVTLESGDRVMQNLTVANDGAGPLQFSIRSGDPSGLVAAEPSSGIVPPGGFVITDVIVDAADRVAGTYETALNLQTNDPSAAERSIPLHVTIGGFPRIELLAVDVDFGEVIVGTTRTRKLKIFNPGTARLEIAPVELGPGPYATNSPVRRVEPGAHADLEIVFAPSSVGPDERQIEITSNDPSNPVLHVTLDGVGIGAPALLVEPSEVQVAIEAGGAATAQLRLSNPGASSLRFDLWSEPLLTAAGQVAETATASVWESLAATPWRAACVVGDPGTRILYAQAAGGTAFARYESGSGEWTPLADAPLPAPSGCGAVVVGRNVYTAYPDGHRLGVYDLDDQRWSTIPAALPHTAVLAAGRDGVLYQIRGRVARSLDPRNLAMSTIETPPFEFSSTESTLHRLGGLLVGHAAAGARDFAGYDPDQRRWVPLPSMPGNGSTATVDPVNHAYHVVDAPGRALHRYDLVSNRWETIEVPTTLPSGASLGWIPAPFAGLFLLGGADGAALTRLILEPAFVEPEPHAGWIEAGGSAEIVLRFDASDRFAGNHDSQLHLRSNDPLSPELIVPLRMALDGRPRAELPAGEVDFQAVFVGIQQEILIPVNNRGTARLELSAALEGASFDVTPASLEVEPGSQGMLTLRFAPSAAGLAEARLHLDTNDPDNPNPTLAIRGVGVQRPVAAVAPLTLETALDEDDTAVRILALRNNGLGLLEFSLQVTPQTTSFVSPDVTQGQLSPDESVEIPVRFDARDLLPGDYPVEIRIATNDPFSPHWSIPSSLTVRGFPDIALGAEPVDLVSTRAFNRYARFTVHDFSQIIPSAGTGTIEIAVEGDFGNDGEIANASVEGITLGEIGNAPADCGVASRSFAIDAESLTQLTADGRVVVDVRNVDGVRAFCPANLHTVRLSYTGAADRLDFGTVFLGATRQLELIVENLGSAPLELGSIVTDRAEFTVGQSVTEIPPGTSVPVMVEFRPLSVEDFEGTLSIHSNDPHTPELRVALEGRGAEPPEVRVEPASLAATIVEGSHTERALQVANDGNGALDIAVTVVGDSSGFVRTDTVTASIPGDGFATIAVQLDAERLAVGLWEATIELSSNDPRQPLLVVPVQVDVVEGPNLLVQGESLTLMSSVDFDTAGALTTHELPIELPPAAGGRFEVIGDGDYGLSGEFAIVVAEGKIIGSIGGVGSDCIPSVGSFTVDRDTLESLVDDAVVRVEVQNTLAVDPFCDLNAHTVRLFYDTLAERLEFGEVFLGQSKRRAVTLINVGSRVLEIESIDVDDGRFAPEAVSFSLAPDERRELGIEFTPDGAATIGAVLSIVSNDPDTPQFSTPISASAIAPPVLVLAPESIDVVLNEGSSRVEAISVANTGSSPLEFEATAIPPEGFDAGFTVFGTDGGAGNLYTLDVLNGSANFVGSLGVGAPALAVDPTTGVMYVGQGGGIPVLYTVDPATAVISAVGDSGLGASAYSAMDFNTNGELFAAANLNDGPGTGGDSLIVVDKRTGQARVIGEFGSGIGIGGGGPGISGMAFDPQSGVLYGATGAQANTDGRPSLYAIDPVTGQASFLRPLVDENGNPPNGGIGSLQFDPAGTLYAGTGRRTGNLLRIEPETGRFTVLAQLFPEALGGLALRRNPVDLSFVEVSPASGTVEAGGSLELSVRLDARALPPGLFDAQVAFDTNDPLRPRGIVPIGLTVEGVPDLAVPGSSVEMASVKSFVESDGLTTHEFAVTAPSAGGAFLTVSAIGDFGTINELAEIRLGGVPLGRVGNAGSDCSTSVATFAISAADFSEILSEGRLLVEVENAPAVGVFCPTNRHEISLSYQTPRETVDFGTVFLDHDSTLPLTLRNDGRAELQVYSIESSRTDVAIGAATPMVIPPFATVEVPLTYGPLSTGPLGGEVVLRSNDPDEPEIVVTLSGVALGAPATTISPDTIEAALPPRSDRIARREWTIENRGASDLVWTAEVIETPPDPEPLAEWVETPKGDESNNGDGALRIDARSDPDGFGYRFRDSDEIDGPRFEWVEIGQTGQTLGLLGDDRTSGAVPLGFDFPFYGNRFDAIFISSNGWLSFSSEKNSYSNADSLPNAGFSVPENLLAPFWDDLDVRQSDAVRYLADDERFIVQYTEIDRFATATELTFQVILHRSGVIVFQYLSMNGVLDSATIGIQNQDRSIGRLVAYNEPYTHDGLAVEFAPLAPWATVEPSAGVIPAGGVAAVEIAMSTRDLDEGRYMAKLQLRSNDPLTPELIVPVTLAATAIELASLEIEPHTIQTGARGPAIKATLQLPAGYDPRRIRIDSVTLGDRVSAMEQFVEFGDANGDGIEELSLRFDRRLVSELLVGPEVTLTLSGEVAGQAWFHGEATVRVIERNRMR